MGDQMKMTLSPWTRLDWTTSGLVRFEFDFVRA